MRLSTYLKGIGAATLATLSATAALAQGLEIIGQPVDGKMGFQPPSTSLAVEQQWLDHMILVIITAVVVLVLSLIHISEPTRPY